MDWPRRITALIRSGGPSMVFQPIVRLSDGERVGFEALSRFPESLPPGSEGVADEAGIGFAPDVWFQAADLHGMGVGLEVAAVRAALALLPDVPGDAYVAINVGPEALVTGAFAAAVSGHDLTRVVVELTEHLTIEDYDAVRKALVEVRRLHNADVCTKIPGIAADDLGAGSASLHHLLLLRDLLTFCKLDVSLTRGIDHDPGRQAIATAIVGLGRADGFAVVAEGVETPEQRETLRSLSVHAGQGWLFGKPSPLPTENP